MFPTVKDVAERAGVSPSTVSRVIANHPRISEATKQRVRAVMRELNYYPNAIARSLVRQRSQTIGVSLSRSAEAALANPFFPEVLRGISSVAEEERYTVMLSTASSYEQGLFQCMELLRHRRVDGLILLTSRSDDPLVKELQAEGYPFVVVGRVPGDSVPFVNNDNVAASYMATMHLIRYGHRRIGFLGGPAEYIVSQDRLTGYIEALRDAGIHFRPELVKETDFSYERGLIAAHRLFDESGGVTAIVAVDDMVALGALSAAEESGLHVPTDLSVVGFNDTPVCPHVAPPLTSVSIPIFEMGAAAARMLCKALANDAPGQTIEGESMDHLVLPARLVVRRSTARVHASKAM